jgi:hypothetical protein
MPRWSRAWYDVEMTAGRTRRPEDLSTSAAPRIDALIEALDPEVRDAIADVDRTLIALSLEQSPWDRLRSASRMAQALSRIRDAATPQRS